MLVLAPTVYISMTTSTNFDCPTRSMAYQSRRRFQIERSLRLENQPQHLHHAGKHDQNRGFASLHSMAVTKAACTNDHTRSFASIRSIAVIRVSSSLQYANRTRPSARCLKERTEGEGRKERREGETIGSKVGR
jgi:hypothetical protein